MTDPRRPSLPDQAKKLNDSEPPGDLGNAAAKSAPRRASPFAPLPPRMAGAESPETCLLRALRARDAEERELFAHRGLSRCEDDPELAALLLRQLYLVHLERLAYTEALAVADEMIELGELGDVARQDAARAAMGLGLLDVAAGHLRVAARICPADRRAFHLGTLGALLRFGGRPEEAVDAFSRASRWATKDRSLYRAQQVLCETEARLELSADPGSLRENLESAESARGYTLWVLGELCALLGDREASRRYLTSFLSRTTGASPAKSLALQGEIARAEALLQELSA